MAACGDGGEGGVAACAAAPRTSTACSCRQRRRSISRHVTHLPETCEAGDTWAARNVRPSPPRKQRSFLWREDGGGVTRRLYAPDPRRLAGTELSVRHAPLRRPTHTHLDGGRIMCARPPERLCDRVRRLRRSPRRKPIDTLSPSILSHTLERLSLAGLAAARHTYGIAARASSAARGILTHTRLHIAGCRSQAAAATLLAALSGLTLASLTWLARAALTATRFAGPHCATPFLRGAWSERAASWGRKASYPPSPSAPSESRSSGCPPSG